MRAAALALVLLVAPGCGAGSGARESSDPNLLQGDEIKHRHLRRVEEMLRGQVAGVRVEERGGQLVVRIRGNTSFVAGQEPLFVIDGIPLMPSSGDALLGIAPSDVESIRVLKNASETAIYGSRGANGVILITTVRPPPPGSDETKRAL